MTNMKQIFNIKEKNQSFSTPQRQSAEAVEDFTVKKVVQTQEGEFNKLKVNDNTELNGDLSVSGDTELNGDLEVTGDLSSTGATFSDTLLLDQNNDGIGLRIDTEASTISNYGLSIETGKGCSAFKAKETLNNETHICRPGDNSYGSNWFYRNLPSGTTSGPVVYIQNSNSGDDQPALKIGGNGSGNLLAIDSNGSGNAIKVDHDGSDTAVAINSGLSNSSNVLYLKQDHADTTGATLKIVQDGTGACITLESNQDVNVINFDACTDAGTAHTTVAGSLKVKMPDGSTGYINFYT